MKWWLLLCILLSPIAPAQTKFLGSYPAASALTGSELMPIVQGGAVLESSPLAMLTYIQSNFTFNFSNIGNGTNTGGTLVCGPGCSVSFSGSGTINANLLNGLAVPASCGIATTNASSQITCVNGTQYTPISYAALTALGCSSSNAGQQYVQSDSGWAPTRGSGIAGSGTSQWPVVCLSDAGSYAWVYL
jgi:hypothetical protein